MYCPVDNGSHVPAGCVAVAMAQVLYKWNCRVEGTGQHSYQSDYGTLSADFENANYQWHAMSATSSNQYNALLIYHCGVSVDMDYGPISSGAPTKDAEHALQNYFGFQSKANYIRRTWHPFDWKSILRGNLNRGLPIIYRGQNKLFGATESHAWVIDGYDGNDLFHCNWGWGGDFDEYYHMGGFSPDEYDFNKLEAALVEIEPVRSTGVETPVLSPKTFTYNPNGYSITISEAEGATSYQWTCNHGTIQGSGTTATLYSDCNSTVSVRAYNSQCQIYSGYDSEIMTIEYGPITGSDIVCYSPNQTFTLHNCPSGSSVSWTKSSNLTYVSETNTTYTVHANSSTTSGEGWIQAYITTNNCDPITVRYNLWVGPPRPEDVSYDVRTSYGQKINPVASGVWLLCPNTNYYIYVINNCSECSTSNYNWTIPSDWTKYYTSQNMIYINTNNSYGGVVSVDANTCCGYRTIISGYMVKDYGCGGGYYLSFTPNPTTGETQLEIKTEKIDTYTDGDEWEAEIFNQQFILKHKTIKLKNKTYTINTSGWKEGIYFVRVRVKGKLVFGQFIVIR